MIDIHSHLLPGIDDGPKNWEQSLDLCRAVADDGVRLSVATPHLIDGVYENIRPLVTGLTEELRERLEAAGVALDVRAGAEVDVSSRYLVERYDDLPLLAGAGSVLLEMPVAVIPAALQETIFRLRARGIIPVLAHPERNEELQRDPSLVLPWIDGGAALQLDGDSLLGVWGRHTQRCAYTLLERGLFHAMASDAHNTERRPPRLAEALAVATTAIGPEASKLVEEGPQEILQGRCPPTPLYGIDEHASRQQGRQGSRGLWRRMVDRMGGRNDA